MKLDEFESLQQREPVMTEVAIGDLVDQTDRTLLWGYTCERKSWHLYLKGRQFYFICYSYCGSEEPGENDIIYQYRTEAINLTKDHVVPDKRLYPEACDLEFCKLLKDRGLSLPFTTFNEERPQSRYYGKLLPQSFVV